MPKLNDAFELVSLYEVGSGGVPKTSEAPLFVFPVPYQKMNIQQGVRVKSQTNEGRSGSTKQGSGFDDTTVSITLALYDYDCQAASAQDTAATPYLCAASAAQFLSDANGSWSAYAQYAILQKAFRDRGEPVGDSTDTTEDAAQALKSKPPVPRVYRIRSRLTRACGIRTVLFKDMTVADFSGDTHLEVTLKFVEFEPDDTKDEKKSGTRHKAKTTSHKTAGNATTSNTTGDNYYDYSFGQSIDQQSVNLGGSSNDLSTAFDDKCRCCC